MTYEELKTEFDNPTFRRVVKEAHPMICSNCGADENIEYHHIVPLKLGGTNRLTNIIPLCYRCHKAAHHGRHIMHYAKAISPGRKSKCNSEKHFEIFDMFIGGEIGNRKCLELLGYSSRSVIKDRPEFKRYMDSKGIARVRNLIDALSTNRRKPLNDGDIVGEIEYLDGTKSKMIFKDTGANDIEYRKRERSAGKDEAFELWKIMAGRNSHDRRTV